MNPADNHEDPEVAQLLKDFKEGKKTSFTWAEVDILAVELIPFAPPPPQLETHEFGEWTFIPSRR